MNPIRAALNWLDETFFGQAWPARGKVEPPPELDFERVERVAKNRRIARLQAERPGLIIKRDRARRNKKRWSHYQRALEENTAALLKLEGER